MQPSRLGLDAPFIAGRVADTGVLPSEFCPPKYEESSETSQAGKTSSKIKISFCKIRQAGQKAVTLDLGNILD